MEIYICESPGRKDGDRKRRPKAELARGSLKIGEGGSWLEIEREDPRLSWQEEA
jgi:hypothetical protein